jgi:hypothetical protein
LYSNTGLPTPTLFGVLANASAATPEPSALTILLSALPVLGAAVCLRRRRAKA